MLIQSVVDFKRTLKLELRLEGCPSRQAIAQINQFTLL